MSAHFYTSIANQYHHIFPDNSVQINFLKRIFPYNGAKVLDVGCAIGNLSFALSQLGFPVWAFDFDAQMIEIAQSKKPEDSMFPVFAQLDMRNVGQHYPALFFHTVICFGNTLVHLLSDHDIRQFIQAAHQVLSPEGKLTIQILNYQHIIDNQIKTLPLIDNEHIRFERNYEFSQTSDLIDFKTRLTIKSTGQEIANSVQLYPIRKNKLQELLEEAGFGAFEFFGNFSEEAFRDNSLTLIVSCQKGKELSVQE